MLVAALGFSKRYQRKAVNLAKIQGVSYYLRGIRLFRRQCLIVLATLFSLILLTAGLVVLPFGLIHYSPWASDTKLIVTLSVAAGYVVIAAGILWSFFSEARWMRFTKANELLSKVFKEN